MLEYVEKCTKQYFKRMKQHFKRMVVSIAQMLRL